MDVSDFIEQNKKMRTVYSGETLSDPSTISWLEDLRTNRTYPYVTLNTGSGWLKRAIEKLQD
jgi:hypothetical protein